MAKKPEISMWDTETEEESPFESEETNPAEETDLQIASYGLVPELFNGYRRRYPLKHIIWNDELTKQAYEWYLEAANEKQLNLIKKDKLSEEFTEMLETKLKEGVIQVVDEEELAITPLTKQSKNQDIIEKLNKDNQELWIQAGAAKESEEQMYKDLLEEKERIVNLTSILNWLYDFMGNLEWGEFAPSDEDMEKIEAIKKICKGGKK